MARLELIGGFYQARWVGANAQRCVNYYPEFNPKDAPVPVTHYQRPGLVPMASDPLNPAPCRGLYQSSNGKGYTVIGQGVYAIDAQWNLVKLGTLVAQRTSPVSMIDNGTTVLLVDGSGLGYTITLANNAFAPFVDDTGTFTGADRVDYIDTFILWNVPNTNQFGSTLSNVLTIDPTYIASKTDYPDPLQALIVNRHEILLIGRLKTEVWYDAGNTGFPFAELPGAYFEHGTVAKYSVASSDISVFWLGQDLQGTGVVFRAKGYECTRISTHAMEDLFQTYSKGPGLSDAIGYTYQQGGHYFYVLSFPAANATWVYDDATQLWHQRAFTDAQGTLNRDRGNCGAFINGVNCVGDWENGTIYALDRDTYTDTVAGTAYAVSFIRGFPHLLTGTNSQGQPAYGNGMLIEHNALRVDIQVGKVPEAVPDDETLRNIYLRYSDDRGETWSNQVPYAIPQGRYLERPVWNNLGQAMDRVYEISHSLPGPVALQGAWVDGKVLNN